MKRSPVAVEGDPELNNEDGHSRRDGGPGHLRRREGTLTGTT